MNYELPGSSFKKVLINYYCGEKFGLLRNTLTE